MSKIVTCSVCHQPTALYRVEYDADRNKKYVCSKHPKKDKVDQGKIDKKIYDDFCRKIWKKRPHVSVLSGRKLPEYSEHSPRFCNLIRFHMHHVKPEGKESKSKKELDIVLDAEKIIFVTYDEHNVIEYGSDKQKEEIGWNKFIQNREQ